MEALSVLHPDVDRMREEPGPRSVIRRGNEMGRKVAKWLPGALISTQPATHNGRAWKTHIPYRLVTAAEYTFVSSHPLQSTLSSVCLCTANIEQK